MRRMGFAMALAGLLAQNAVQGQVGGIRTPGFNQLIRFELEAPTRKPVPVPAAVLALLNQDERVKQSAGKRPAPASWFSASTVHLDTDRLPDLVVKAEEGRLWGANQGPFWLFRRTRSGYVRVLTAYGLSLELLPGRRAAWRPVRTTAASARRVFTHRYQYRGGRYVETKQR